MTLPPIIAIQSGHTNLIDKCRVLGTWAGCAVHIHLCDAPPPAPVDDATLEPIDAAAVPAAVPLMTTILLPPPLLLRLLLARRAALSAATRLRTDLNFISEAGPYLRQQHAMMMRNSRPQSQSERLSDPQETR